ncbi:MAG TPA: substrate-binding domain-containing protein [Puia sp.]|nr:substrate-binding domain-containing protein [Puia sp.]
MACFLRHMRISAIWIFFGVGLASCSCTNQSRSKFSRDTPTEGTINISVDESFKPVIDSEIKVFESSFPNAHILVHYKPEAACLRDLFQDSTRMVIVTRGLSEAEERYFKDSMNFEPTYDELAVDAVAVIVNKESKDSIFTMDDIRSMLSGTPRNGLQPVMDGTSATSTVRYLIDSVLKGKSLGKNVTAAKSSEGVINYVSDNKNGVGFIGVSWIGDRDDPQQLHFRQKVEVAAVQCESCLGETYVKPFQANIYMGRYPMLRGLYYILKENYSGIGNNFVNFLQYERGQLIFRRAYLLPAKMSFEIRDAQITK